MSPEARERLIGAMRARAGLELDRHTASHLVGNVLAGVLLTLDIDPTERLDVAALFAERIERDRGFRAADPSYPYSYPEDVAALVRDLAAIWRDSQ